MADETNNQAAEQAALKRERWELLQRLEDWLEMPMLVLGIIWLLLQVVELVWGLSPPLQIAGTIIWVPMIFIGASWLSTKLHNKHVQNLAAVALVGVLIGGSLAQRAHSPSATPFNGAALTNARRIRKYEDIKGLGALIGDSTIGNACDDPFKYVWAYYFSRELSVKLLDYKSYFYYIPEILSDSRRPTGPLRFILSDKPGQGEQVWTNGQFWLFREPRV